LGFGALPGYHERKQAEEQIRYLATHDLLTGLPNVSCSTELLEENIQFAPLWAEVCSFFYGSGWF